MNEKLIQFLTRRINAPISLHDEIIRENLIALRAKLISEK